MATPNHLHFKDDAVEIVGVTADKKITQIIDEWLVAPCRPDKALL